MYELAEPDSELGEVEKFDREVQLQIILNVLQFRVKNSVNTKTACEELDVPYRSFMRWIKAGVLTDYLKTVHDPEMDMLRTRALMAMPDVLENMIRIASGTVTIKGVNPVAAANFVKEIVNEIAPPEQVEVPQQVHYHMYQPIQYHIPYQNAAPVIEGGVVEAEAQEIDP